MLFIAFLFYNVFMINFDSLTLKLFAIENADFFLGAKIQKIQQPSKYEIIFSIRSSGQTRKFYINFSPDFYHLCFMSAENEKKRNFIIPKSALMFCMLLRKYVQNAKITKVNAVKNERIFEIYFDYFNELNDKISLCLAIELMGKHSNVILYNYDTNVIIGCAHNVSSEKSRERELFGSMPYVYPPKQNKKNLLKVSFDSFMNSIDRDNLFQSVSAKFNYLTMILVKEIYNKTIPFSFENFYLNLKNFLSLNSYSYYISNDYSVYFLFNIENSFQCENVNSMIDTYFSFHQNRAIKEKLRSVILKLINSRLKKLRVLKEKQDEQIKKTAKAGYYKNLADILMSNAYSGNIYSDVVSLNDFNNQKINIKVDKRLSFTENANNYYLLYKKLKSSFEHLSSLIKNTESEILYLEEQKFYTENASDLNCLKDIYSDMFYEVDNSLKEKESSTNVDYVEYKGYRIYTGKNKKQNDIILSKISSPEDIWLHPLNAAGAHVLIKINNSNDVIPDDVILKAAKIAKDYSSQKNNSKTSIIYTKRKYVKKANNKIAFVTYKNETEIVV